MKNLLGIRTQSACHSLRKCDILLVLEVVVESELTSKTDNGYYLQMRYCSLRRYSVYSMRVGPRDLKGAVHGLYIF